MFPIPPRLALGLLNASASAVAWWMAVTLVGMWKKRIANAKKASTFPLAEAQIMETYKLANIDWSRFPPTARLDFKFNVHSDFRVERREPFSASLVIIS